MRGSKLRVSEAQGQVVGVSEQQGCTLTFSGQGPTGPLTFKI